MIARPSHPDPTLFALPRGIEPEESIPLSTPERLVIAAATAVMAVSTAMGHFTGIVLATAVLGVGLAMTYFRTDRMQRRSARALLPHLPWAENAAQEGKRGRALIQFGAWIGVYLAAVTLLIWGPSAGNAATVLWALLAAGSMIAVYWTLDLPRSAAKREEDPAWEAAEVN